MDRRPQRDSGRDEPGEARQKAALLPVSGEIQHHHDVLQWMGKEGEGNSRIAAEQRRQEETYGQGEREAALPIGADAQVSQDRQQKPAAEESQSPRHADEPRNYLGAETDIRIDRPGL